jgi:hypothetical protein
VLELCKVTIACCYSSERVDGPSWALRDAMFKCLPDRNYKLDVDERTRIEYDALQDKIDTMDQHISAGEVLAQYKLAKPMSFFRDCDAVHDHDECVMLIRRMCQTKVRAQKTKADEWAKLRDDITGHMGVKTLVFPFVAEQECMEVYLGSLLEARQFDLARALVAEGSLNLPAEIASSTCLRIGRDFFNRADNSADSLMQAAAHCFALVQPPSEAALKEINLIKAVKIAEGLKLEYLPTDLRKGDGVRIIAETLKQKPDAYEEWKILLAFAECLGLTGVASSNHVKLLVVARAVEQDDYQMSRDLLIGLVADHYANCWELCRKIGLECMYDDWESRKELLSFAMLYCDPNELGALVRPLDAGAPAIHRSIPCHPPLL